MTSAYVDVPSTEENDDPLGDAELRRYARGTELLVGAVQELSLARDLAQIQRIVRTTARALTGADGTTFVLNDGGLFCYYADEDAIAPLWKGLRFPQESCISGWAMRHRQPVVVPDIYADPRIPHDAYRPTFVKSLAIVPIRTLDPVGAIGAYWAHDHVPTASDLQLLQALADSTSVAMENLRVHEELERRVNERTAALTRANSAIHELSVTDNMTGLANRRGFFDAAARALPDARRVLLAYLDVDGLKRANDLHGHAAGDDLLTGLAAVLRSCFGDAGFVARLGGDEFCALVCEPSVGAGELRRRVDEGISAFNRAQTRPYALSASLGIVEADGGDAGELDTLLRQADALMYREKNAKRAAR